MYANKVLNICAKKTLIFRMGRASAIYMPNYYYILSSNNFVLSKSVSKQMIHQY